MPNNIHFGGGGASDSVIELTGIAITTAPNKTSYYVGDTFDTTGMVITATYSFGLSNEITGYTISPSGALSAGTTAITITYSEAGVTKTATQKITVTKKSVIAPSTSSSLTYTGSSQSPTWSNYDTSKMTISGDTSGTNAGDYSTTFTLKDTNKYQWSDGTTAAKTINWSISRAKIASVPSQSNSLSYTGSAQSPTWNNYDTAKMTLGGTTSGTNAGSYNATFTPGDNYQWSDGTTAAKTVAWTIAKIAGSLSISKTSITLNPNTTSATITVTRAGDGKITAKSSDTSVASVSVSGTTVTVSSVNETTGTATITISVAAGTNHTAPADKTCAVTAQFVTIYGVQWDGTSTTALSRTDAAAYFTDPDPATGTSVGSSPFDDLYPWAGMVRSTDSVAGELVAIPKYYYKWTVSGNTVKLQIADGPVDDFLVSPAHADRGDGAGERELVYVGRYHCHTSNYKSATGGKPKASVTRSAARTAIHNLGSNIWQWDWAMNWTIKMLYLVEFADWNSQAKIGYGCGNNSSTENMGSTDSMNYHTGTKSSSLTTYAVGVQYRNIEGLWDNVYDWVDGCYYNSSGLNVILNPNSFNDSANGTVVGTLTSGYPSALTVKTAANHQWLLPSASSGSNTTYVPDSWGFGSSSPCLCVGGGYSQGLARGLFCVYCGSSSFSYAYVGCRLMKLP